MAESTRNARLGLLRTLLEQERFASQQELSAELAKDGIKVSQSTLSKDLERMGAIRRRGADRALVYALNSDGDPRQAAHDKLARLCAELVSSMQSAGNQLVLRTPPGAAQFFAAAIDAARLKHLMGTIAGDDTILIIAVDETGAQHIASVLSEMTRTGKALKEES